MTERAQLYWEDIDVGQEVPPFIRMTDHMNWTRHMAAYGEFIAMFMDDEAGRANGLPGAQGPGLMRTTYLHGMLHEWIGDEGFIKRLSAQFRGSNLRGDILTCNARVTGKRVEGGEHLVDLELSIDNQKNENVNPGEATVILPSRTGRQGAMS